MTSLVAWSGVDSGGQASLYLAADSRLTDKDGRRWDRGRKLFASFTRPEILGYAGDVLFPSQVLGQLTSAIDAGLLDGCVNADARALHLRSLLDHSFREYPRAIRADFSVLYCTRESEGVGSAFRCFQIDFRADGFSSVSTECDVGPTSDVVCCLGSGKTVMKAWMDKWFLSKQMGAKTSRSIFGGFCDAVASGEDVFSGGGPQLVGLYKKGSAKGFGVVTDQGSYLFGLQVTDGSSVTGPWRNTCFEDCDWRGKLRPGCQRQPRPADVEMPRRRV